MKTSKIIVSVVIGIVWAVCAFFIIEEYKVEAVNFQEQELLFDRTRVCYYVMNGDESFVVENFSSLKLNDTSSKTRIAFEGKKVYTFYWKGDFKVYPKEEGDHKYFLSNLRTYEASLVVIVGIVVTAIIVLAYNMLLLNRESYERYTRKLQEENDRKYQEKLSNKQ